ncbi:cytochrome-c peroxidase [soil metagenome]
MWLAALALMSALVGCGNAEGSAVPDLGPAPVPGPVAMHSDENPRLLRRFRPLRRLEPADGDQIALGKMLYFDPRLSRGRDLSCNSCHALDRAGVDARAVSLGHNGKPGKRNAPTVYNTAQHIALFWDGRAADLEQQATAPILDPDEMAMLDRRAVEKVLDRIPGYVTAFGRAYPGEPIDLAHVGKALAAFERTLVTPSRWDRYLEGDHSALTPAEHAGLKLFADIGCVQCHTGELVGASMFQRVGVVEKWPNQADQGRYIVTKLDADRMGFKVPSLRNVTLTGPYFHDGSVTRLRTAIAMMAKHQLGTELTEQEVISIETWLGTLTGTPVRVAAPALP